MTDRHVSCRTLDENQEITCNFQLFTELLCPEYLSNKLHLLWVINLFDPGRRAD